MAITKQEYLNKLEINVQTPHLEVVRRVSFYDGDTEISRNHIETMYTTANSDLLFVSESQLVQDIWTLISGSEFVL